MYRKDNVLELWTYLLELLRARRLRLELSLKLQKIFQEMLYILDWMDEIKVIPVDFSEVTFQFGQLKINE
jgi:spectrin beta